MTTHREPWLSAAEPLGEALHFLELRGAFHCRAEFTAPFDQLGASGDQCRNGPSGFCR